MTVAEFERADGKDLTGALLALWWDAHGEWGRAHEVAQDVAGRDGAWVHGYLHRKEGDLKMRPIGIGRRAGRWSEASCVRSGSEW